MLSLRNIISNDSWTRVFSLFFLTFIFAGSFLIIQSIINISFIENNLKSETSTNFNQKSNIHDNFPKLLIHNNNYKHSYDKLISPNNSISNELDLNKEISALNDSQIQQNDFYPKKSLKANKEKFISTILPFVIQENNLILIEREKLLKIKNLLIVNKTLNKTNQIFLEKIAKKYKINIVNKHKIDTIKVLLEKVDIIPNSIVLAQSANESGWGNSRFAKEFNAFFGEYTFDVDNGVIPNYRDDGEKYLIKFFSNINESVRSYFINLNTHPAYNNFRQYRKKLRMNDYALDPIKLVQHLKLYAKDKNYIQTIESIIKTNDLIQYDNLKSITTKS